MRKHDKFLRDNVERLKGLMGIKFELGKIKLSEGAIIQLKRVSIVSQVLQSLAKGMLCKTKYAYLELLFQSLLFLKPSHFHTPALRRVCCRGEGEFAGTV